MPRWVTSKLQAVRRVNLLVELTFENFVPQSVNVVNRIWMAYG